MRVFLYDAHKQAIRKVRLNDVEKWKSYKPRHVMENNWALYQKNFALEKFTKAHDLVHKIKINKTHGSMSKHIEGEISFFNHAKHLVRLYCYIYYYFS